MVHVRSALGRFAGDHDEASVHPPCCETAVSIGVVVIGRNEGERLRKCLESVLRVADRAVYVDSGSTDDSVAMALGMGLEIIELDLGTPFTAARADRKSTRLSSSH